MLVRTPLQIGDDYTFLFRVPLAAVLCGIAIPLKMICFC